jgi:preprotein translocase subunit SecA
MRLFGSERVYFFMEKFGFPEDQPIEHGLINHSLEIAQKRVESHNFEIRKQLLEYDNVMNKQREIIYQQRRQILEQDNIREEIFSMVSEVIEKNIPLYLSEEINLSGLAHWLKAKFDLGINIDALNKADVAQIISFIEEEVKSAYQKKDEQFGREKMLFMERVSALWVVDSRWKEHLLVMDSLKEGIHLRSYGHSEPLVEYQKESYAIFQETISSIKEGIVEAVFKAKIVVPEEMVGVFEQAPKSYVHSEYSSLQKSQQEENASAKPPSPQMVKKVGRNEPCPCGSGKKYKKCCGK